MRPSSPALSEASSCTLVENTPEVVPNPNSVVTNSTAPNTQAPFSPLPASSTAPTQKRPRERSDSNELLWTDRENFNSAKRRIGVSGAVSSNVNAALSTTRFPTFSPTAVPNQENQEVLSSSRGHPFQAKIDSLALPLRVSTPRANKNPLRQTSPLISQDIIELDDEEALPLFKLPDGAELINLEDYDGEDALEEEILGIGPEILNKDNIKRPSLARRNPDILPPDVEISSIPWKSSVLRPGKTVEISDGSFIKIKSLIKDITNDEVSIRGWKLVRTRDFVLGGIVRKKRNEVAFLHEIDRDDGRDVWEQSVHAIRPEEVARIRRLVCTNRPFPECRYQKEDIPSEIKMKEEKEAMRHVEDEMVLVARWALVARFSNAETRVRTASVLDRPRNSVILRSLREDECTKGDYADSHIKQLLWRGETVLGGSGNLNSGSSSSRYTYGDGCKCKPFANSRNLLTNQSDCGAGGMTVGAAAAGLKVEWGFDFNHHAGNTWQKNFPRASFHFLPVNEFAALPDPNQDLWVDILHLSPPCQVFSPVHTVPGQNDDMNYASLFGVRCTIEKTRPRIVTLEQTFGILHPKNKDAFNGLISCFTDFGFDVSWQVVKFQGYGTPSRRTRLIILASWYAFSSTICPTYARERPS